LEARFHYIKQNLRLSNNEGFVRVNKAYHSQARQSL